MAWGDKVDPNPNDPQSDPFELEGVTQQDFDTIRSLLLTSLEEEDLPNEMISNDGYLVDAIREVKKSLGEDVVTRIVADTTSERFSIYKLAVFLLTAYYMCDAVEQLASESLGPIRRSWGDTDKESTQEKLLSRYQDKLDELTEKNTASIGFGVLQGSRGSFGRRRPRGSM